MFSFKLEFSWIELNYIVVIVSFEYSSIVSFAVSERNADNTAATRNSKQGGSNLFKIANSRIHREKELSSWKDKFPLENRISGDHLKNRKTLVAPYLQNLRQSISTIVSTL